MFTRTHTPSLSLSHSLYSKVNSKLQIQLPNSFNTKRVFSLQANTFFVVTFVVYPGIVMTFLKT